MIAALVAFAIAAPAAAPVTLPGIWQGTVGDLPVRACFAGSESGSFGAYYYLSRGRLIPLEQAEGASGSFVEGGGTDANRPRWLIERADSAQLMARWSGRGRSLPVRLARVALAGGESPCASMVFHRQRLSGVRTVTARASRDGVAYSRITLDHGGRFAARFATFALDGTSDAARRINAILARPLAGDPPEWFDCVRSALEQGPNEGDFDESLQPAMISRRWLSAIDRYDGYCGGAHPDGGRTYRTFDLARGREIDLHDWLNGAAVERQGPAGSEEGIKTLRPALRDLILARWTPQAAECGEVVRAAEFWNIGLTRRALVFSPDLPHVVQACGEDFIIPFARLRPFLTQAGAAELRALEAEARRR